MSSKKKPAITPPKIEDEKKALEVLSSYGRDEGNVGPKKTASPYSDVSEGDQTRARKAMEEKNALTGPVLTESTVPSLGEKKAPAELPVSTRPKTGSGRKLHGGKVAIPKVKVGEGGRLVPTSPEERRAAATTVVPQAKTEVAEKKDVLPGGGASVDSQPFNTSVSNNHELARGLTQQAFTHLERMHATHGNEEFHHHHAIFNEVHASLSAVDHSLGVILGVARHSVVNRTSETPKHLAYAKQAASERIALGNRAIADNVSRSRAGYAKRMERIRAEREGR